MEPQRDTQFQDLEWARPRIKTRLLNNKKQEYGTSVSGLYSMLRKEPHLSLIGDYSLFWIIIDETKETSKTKIANALRKSQEFNGLRKKERMWWLQSFVWVNSKDDQYLKHK